MKRATRVLAGALLSLAPLTAGVVVAPHTVSATPAATAYYTVKSGDTLIGIAGRLKVTLDALLKANKMTLTSFIYPGQKLAIPTKPAAPLTSNVTYTIKSGDYLAGIAYRHKVKLADLLSVNKLTATSVIHPGQVLKLPAGAVTPAKTASTGASGGVGVSTLTYTVQSGDFLSGIASRHKVKLSQLLAVNKLTVSSLITPGQLLKLPAGATAPANPVATGNRQIDLVVGYARAQLGKPYKFFTAGPSSFDCSGLTKAAFAQIDISLPHYSLYQTNYGTPIDWYTQPIKAGDLVFKLSSRNPTRISHVGIAISATEYIHSPASGDVVKISPMPPDSAIKAVRRLVP
jgi:peptidoglycan endopeptidase LytE